MERHLLVEQRSQSHRMGRGGIDNTNDYMATELCPSTTKVEIPDGY